MKPETPEQAIKRRELKPVQWTEHVPSYFGCLGPNYELVIEELIEERVQELHDGSTGSKKHLPEFLKVEPDLRNSYWKHVEKAERFLTQYRREHDMQPFNWALESLESVRSLLALDGGDVKLPRTIEKKQQIVLWKQQRATCQTTDTMSVRELSDTMKIKPEYQGLNHPLERNQIKRKKK